MANACEGEGTRIRLDGEGWAVKLMRYASDSRSHTLQKMFDVSSLDGLDVEIHQRAWSMFDLFLEEDRDRFVAFLADLRDAKDPRKSVKERFGISPEELEQRWRDRILRKRDSVAATPEEVDAAEPGLPGAAEREAIRLETDPATLAAKVRALEKLDDPLTAATILPLLQHPSELVRETVALILARTTSPAVLEWLRTEGLARFSGVVRAGVARALGTLRDEAAAPACLALLGDGNWLVRVYAARALGRVRHLPAVPALRNLLDDGVAKVRMAAMDALAEYGEDAGEVAESVGDHLGDANWQVRSAAAECLGALGDRRGIEALIARMEIEDGRIRKDIHDALKRITRDDLGANPKHWRDWWEKARKTDGAPPPRPAKSPEDERYGKTEPPTIYGLRVFSRLAGYVVDTSFSMAYEAKVDPAWLKRSGRDFPAVGTKAEFARREIGASLATLDPRTHFNVWFFRTAASRWKSKAVPATPQNVSAALRRIEAESPREGVGGEAWRTNYVDLFRLILGIRDGEGLPRDFRDTPDTLYFLTDGKPTVGEIVDHEILLGWIREHNRFARMRLNVISFGHETNDRFLSALAGQNGGGFVVVPDIE
jgi:hypothetical protein